MTEREYAFNYFWCLLGMSRRQAEIKTIEYMFKTYYDHGNGD